jgi:hypothetical protein
VVSINFTLVELTGLGGGFSAAVAVNDDGTAVGVADDGASVKAARWILGGASAAASELSPLSGNEYSAAYGINNLHVAVGESGATVDAVADANTLAVFWPDGSVSPTELSTQGLFAGGAGSAYGINDLGEIVGEAVNDGEGNTVAVYWASTSADPVILGNLTNGGFSSAYFIGADGFIVGESRNSEGAAQAVIWEPGPGGAFNDPIALDPLVDQIGSVAFGADLDGRIVGEVELSDGVVHGVIWNVDGTITADLGVDTTAMAINNNNRIAGATAAATGNDQAAVWNVSEPGEAKNLAESFSQAYGISDNLHLVGISGTQAFAATPEQE